MHLLSALLDREVAGIFIKKLDLSSIMTHTLRDIGEFGLIKKLFSKVKQKDVIKGMGDDAAVVKVGKELLLLSTDTLVEDIHFNFKWFYSFS